LRHEVVSIDRSGIGQRSPATRAGAWRNVGADCLVGGTRGLEARFLFTFRKYKVFVERGHDTHAIAANSCDIRRVKSWFLSCVGRQGDAIITSNIVAMSRRVIIRLSFNRYVIVDGSAINLMQLNNKQTEIYKFHTSTFLVPFDQ